MIGLLRGGWLPAVLCWMACSTNGNNESLPNAWQAFIVCEGNYGSGNGEITLLDTIETDTTHRRAFAAANDGKLGDNPRGAWLLGETFFVAVTGSDRVAMIDVQTMVLTDVIENVVTPRAGTTDGTMVYVTEFEDSTVAAIDPLAKSVTKRWKLTHKPDEIAWSGSRLYVSAAPGQNDSIISSIDITTDIVQTSVIGHNPVSLAAVPRLGEVYVACAGSSTAGGYVAVVDMTTLSVKSTIDTDTRPVRITAQDPWVAYIISENGNVRVRNIDSGIQKETSGRNYFSIGWGNGEIIGLDARDFVGHGEAHWLDTALTLRKVMSTDVAPVTIVFKP